MSFSRLLMLLLCLLALGGHGSSIFAQTNPPVAACGLPAQGVIWASVTYTLTADCAQTGRITIYSPPDGDPRISLTINGGGHTISGGAFTLILGADAILNLNDVTIDGAQVSTANVISIGTVNANRVTFTRGSNGPLLNPTMSNLTDVLFAWNISSHFALGGSGSAVHAGINTTHNWNNVVMRNNIGNGGAISLLTGATLTTTGCLTLSGNAPYDVYAPDGTTWTDNSTGPCSGTIGNGDSADIPAPALMDCGFPAAGNLDVSATYTLTGDCELTGAYYISEDVNIRIIGNAYAMRTSRTGYSFYTAATSSLRLENVALEGIRLFNWGEFSAEKIKVSESIGGILLNMGDARFTNALFEGNSVSSQSGRSVALAYNAYQNGYTSFTNVTFRGNTGGLGALATFGAVIDLNGCIHFADNSPADTYVYAGRGGVINDNRDPNCDSPIVDPLIPPPSGRPSAPSAPKAICNPHCPELLLRYCDIKLGAIGLVCRPPQQPPEAYVYRITTESEGFFKLGVSQPQVEAVEEGLVACSADGRVAVRTGLPPEIRHFFEIAPKYQAELLVPRRYILISQGPNVEGKVNHVVLDNALDGRVFGIVSTFGGLPAAECITRQAAAEPTPAPVQYAEFVQPQSAQPDGAILHIVRPGDTINGIAVAYETDPLEIIIFNQLEDMGRWIYPGQELLIREAGA